MQLPGQRAAAEYRREPAEEPGKIDAETREQRQKEKEGDHPVEKARVHAVAQQFAFVDFGLADAAEGVASFIVETFNGGGHQLSFSLIGGSGCGRRGPTVT